MYYFHLFLLLLVLSIFVYISYSKHSCYPYIDNSFYPEAQLIFNSKSIILEDLNKILYLDKWNTWSSLNDVKAETFSNLTCDEKLSRMKNTDKLNVQTTNPSWKLFGLILEKNVLPNAILCKNTLNILKSPKIINAGFSVLEPHFKIGSHKDYDKRFYRLHIPLILPKNNNLKLSFLNEHTSKNNYAVLQIKNTFRAWIPDEYFIFDDTMTHDAWNNTDELRIILIVDLEK